MSSIEIKPSSPLSCLEVCECRIEYLDMCAHCEYKWVFRTIIIPARISETAILDQECLKERIRLKHDSIAYNLSLFYHLVPEVRIKNKPIQ